MGFSGGGGLSTITAHKHTNTAGDGGALDNTTLLNATALATQLSAIVSSKVVVLDDHTAAGAESSYTFTPSSAIANTTYSKIVVVIQMEATAGLNMQYVVNGLGAVHDSNGAYDTGVALTSVQSNGQAFHALTTFTISAGVVTEIILEITMTNTATPKITGVSRAFGRDNTLQLMGHGVSSNVTQLTSLKFQTSASTWKTGSRITTFGYLPA